MASYSKTTINIIKFILHEASDQEVEAIAQALEKRKAVSPPHSLADLDFKKMAGQALEGFDDRFGLGVDIHQMTRKLVGELILDKVPGIPPEDLEKLLDEWAPSPEKAKEQNTSRLPSDLVMTMVEQFVAYSLGKMPAQEKEALAEQMPNWPEKYWSNFTPAIRSLIAELLKGQKEMKDFWKELEMLLVQ